MTTPTDGPSIRDALAEIRRELALRGRVYPAWVAKGSMKQETADLYCSRLEKASLVLEWCERNQAALREVARLRAQPKMQEIEREFPGAEVVGVRG